MTYEHIIDKRIHQAVQYHKGSDLNGNRMGRINDLAMQFTSMGFEIYNSDRFAEFYISELIGATRESARMSAFDCSLRGQRIEIKHSKLIDGCAKNYKFKYFHWGSLFGSNGNKKGKYDILLLSGWDGGRWWFWVIPYSKVKHYKVEFQISERVRGAKVWNWIHDFYIGDDGDLQRYFNENS